MANGQRTKTSKGSGSKAAISDASTLSPNSESTQGNELRTFHANTTATTLKGSKKIWKSAELVELQSQVGLVAGVLADFQMAKGLIVREEVTYKSPSGRDCKAIKLILLVEDMNLVAVKTADGIDFNLVVAEEK